MIELNGQEYVAELHRIIGEQQVTIQLQAMELARLDNVLKGMNDASSTTE